MTATEPPKGACPADGCGCTSHEGGNELLLLSLDVAEAEADGQPRWARLYPSPNHTGARSAPQETAAASSRQLQIYSYAAAYSATTSNTPVTSEINANLMMRSLPSPAREALAASSTTGLYFSAAAPTVRRISPAD